MLRTSREGACETLAEGKVEEEVLREELGATPLLSLLPAAAMRNACNLAIWAFLEVSPA